MNSPLQSNAFVSTLDLPPVHSGPLNGLTFAAKDVIDIAGHKTGGGNPSWRDTHPPAVAHAVCVEQLLQAGARCIGKTVSDELAFSLLGQNHFFGTPLNPRAPDRVPGGSSSGSASAVACGLVDFALGTDTGGSIRIPAHNCGVWGYRPTHGVISMAGVNCLAPSFDTVGILASSAAVLAQVASVLNANQITHSNPPGVICLIRDAFALADAQVQAALAIPLNSLRQRFGDRVKEVALHEIVRDDSGGDFANWAETFCVLQWAEIQSCLGAWIADVKPTFGAAVATSFGLTSQLDRGRITQAIQHRESYRRQLQSFLGPYDLICMPTAPALAPRLTELPARSSSGTGYYPRTQALTSVAGIGRLPQVSMPVGDSDGVPIGLSLLAKSGQDKFLLETVQRLSFD